MMGRGLSYRKVSESASVRGSKTPVAVHFLSSSSLSICIFKTDENNNNLCQKHRKNVGRVQKIALITNLRNGQIQPRRCRTLGKLTHSPAGNSSLLQALGYSKIRQAPACMELTLQKKKKDLPYFAVYNAHLFCPDF